MHRFRPTLLRLATAIAVATCASAGVAYAASLGLSSNKLFASGQTLTRGSCDQTYTTAYDTYVDQQNPTSSFETATTLTIQGGSSKADYAFIRFDLSGCNLPPTGGADSSTLTLFVTSAGKDTISLFPVYSSWSPSTLTWNGVSGLTIGSTATTSFTPTATGSFSLAVTADVDAAIKAGTLWGWELRDTAATKTTLIASAENGTVSERPSLTLSYEK
jgi:hypothetical protein